MTYLKMPLQLQSAVAKKIAKVFLSGIDSPTHHATDSFSPWGSYRPRRLWFHDMGP